MLYHCYYKLLQFFIFHLAIVLLKSANNDFFFSPKVTNVKTSNFSYCYRRRSWCFGGRRECTRRSSPAPSVTGWKWLIIHIRRPQSLLYPDVYRIRSATSPTVSQENINTRQNTLLFHFAHRPHLPLEHRVLLSTIVCSLLWCLRRELQAGH